MFIIRKIFKFEMAHQLKTCYSACCRDAIHGHHYLLELFFKSEKLDESGMVIDFGEVKEKLKEYINSWDHAIVMPNSFDSEYIDSLKKYNKKIKIVNYNPTAENMSNDIYDTIKKIFPQLSKVRLHETDTGYSEYYEEECCCK